MRYSELINEGLIAIPQSMQAEIDFFVDFLYIVVGEGSFKGKIRQFPEQYAAFKALVAKNDIELPPEAYKPKDGFSIHKIQVSNKGMPANYPQPKEEFIIFALRWTDTARMTGSWNSARDALLVFPLSLDYLKRYPSPTNDPEDLEIAIKTLKDTVSHELRHMVQTIFLSDHPEQLKMKTKYHDYKADYHSSPIEFDPMIGSLAGEFLHLWNTYQNASKNSLKLNDSVRQYVGLGKSDNFSIFSPPPFFKALKKEAPERYKIAVKKFITELSKQIAQIG